MVDFAVEKYKDLIGVGEKFGSLEERVKTAQLTADEALAGVGAVKLELNALKHEKDNEVAEIRTDMSGLRQEIRKRWNCARLMILVRVLFFCCIGALIVHVLVFLYSPGRYLGYTRRIPPSAPP